ncbi:hypothetical protein [Nocardia sp.]|uniref:hypothetical protein n=1 Tax=Nocardia sp. TaxID=1821 RepID=UPI00262F4D45|nr:hypothetical protein [Nocardia sp.]
MNLSEGGKADNRKPIVLRSFVSTIRPLVMGAGCTGPFHPHHPPHSAMSWLSTLPSPNLAVMCQARDGWLQTGHFPK